MEQEHDEGHPQDQHQPNQLEQHEHTARDLGHRRCACHLGCGVTPEQSHTGEYNWQYPNPKKASRRLTLAALRAARTAFDRSNTGIAALA